MHLSASRRRFYRKALDYMRGIGHSLRHLLIITDTPGAWKDVSGLDRHYPAMEIAEDDVRLWRGMRRLSSLIALFISGQSIWQVWPNTSQWAWPAEQGQDISVGTFEIKNILQNISNFNEIPVA